MTYKEYGEQAEIEYTLTVTVNDEKATVLTASSEESLLEQLRKADHAINRVLTEQYEDLPENQESENEE